VGPGAQVIEIPDTAKGAPVSEAGSTVEDSKLDWAESGTSSLADSTAHLQPSKQVKPRGRASQGPHRGGVFKWEWIPQVTLDLTHSHPATLSDVAS
jgi:hypothetical protein